MTYCYKILDAAGGYLMCGGFKSRVAALEAAVRHAKVCGEQIQVRRVTITED